MLSKRPAVNNENTTSTKTKGSKINRYYKLRKTTGNTKLNKSTNLIIRGFFCTLIPSNYN